MHGAHLTSGSQKSNKFILIHNHGSQQKTKVSITISNSGSQKTQQINQRTFYRTIGSLSGIAGSLMGLKNQNNKRLLTKSNDHPKLNV
jgi:hypothetical protein